MKFLEDPPKPIFKQHWKPLEHYFCKMYMFMGSHVLKDGTIVHTYKHIDTREYINLSDDGRSWKYTGAGYEVER